MENDLKLLFSEIINGYTTAEYEDLGVFYIKHLNNLDSSALEVKRDYYFKYAQNAGLVTSDQKERELIEENEWSEDKNREIRNLEVVIKNLNNTKKKLITQAQKKHVERQIVSENQKLKRLKFEKFLKLGNTCDFFADKKVNEYVIYYSFYQDDKLTSPRFSWEEFNDLETQELQKLVLVYNNRMNNYTEDNFKKLALNPRFMNLYMLCEDNPYNLWGRALIELTMYQLELFSFGRYFKHIMKELKTTQLDYEVYENPQILIDRYEVGQASGNISRKASESDGVGVVGDVRDRKNMGLEDGNAINLTEAAKKKGGSLSMQDLIQLQGGKT